MCKAPGHPELTRGILDFSLRSKRHENGKQGICRVATQSLWQERGGDPCHSRDLRESGNFKAIEVGAQFLMVPQKLIHV